MVSPIGPARTAEASPQGLRDGRAGMGGRSKRTPRGNGADRGWHIALPRKGADFRLVLDHEKGTERLNHRGYFRRCVPLGAIEGPVGALRQLSTSPYREGDPLRAAGCFAAPYQGLSPVRGNLHAGFSGGRVTVTSPGYPTVGSNKLYDAVREALATHHPSKERPQSRAYRLDCDAFA